jgi:serine/threonine protein kinase/Tol biopolymer transport system component
MIGKTISHYKILEKLGEGGMGVVYKARDTHLDRFVALKILPAEKVADPERRRRFVQEAKAASALNHPHIVTIYDIDEADGVHFIAMEYVDGRTLDQLIPRHGMRLNEALKVAVQVADALAAAHEAGIVHRDLKPGNLMVTEKGQVKVLDFGLAKLTEKLPVSAEDATLTAKPDTEEGKILGTVAYMSPEQAEGKKVDARSDIFSFGSVLYEMFTGRMAFHGETKASTLAAILKENPKPASQVVEALPKEVERLISRCLRKKRERRWQTIADLKVALEELKEESDSGALEAAGSPGAAVRSKLWWAGVLTGMALVAVVLGIADWFWFSRSRPTPAEAPLTAVPLTSYRGWESFPSFSPDGTRVAFQWCQEGQKCHIYIKQVGVEPPFQLTNAAMDEYCPAWSPDGQSIAFMRGLGLFLIPQHGGSERQLGTLDVSKMSQPLSGPYLAWTPDSKWLASPWMEAEQRNGALFLISVETGEKRRLTTAPADGSGDTSPAFSPDGGRLAFSRDFYFHSDLYLLRLGEGYKPQGEPKRVETANLFNIGTAWTPNGREIVFASGNGPIQGLWRMEVSKPGKPVRVGFATDNAGAPSISRTGKRLAYSVKRFDSNIWRVDLEGPGRKPGKPMLFISSTKWEYDPEYSPDGKRIAFVSEQSGASEIWICDSDGRNPVQLTKWGSDISAPRWSPDGKNIAVVVSREGNVDVYVVSAGGSAPRRFTTDPGQDNWPFWSRDGRWLYFGSARSGQIEIWKMPSQGGEAIQVTRTHTEASVPQESPDGKFIYYCRGWPFAMSVWRMPLEGGEESKVLDSVHPLALWTIRPEGIYFFTAPDDKGSSDFCFYEFANSKITKILKMERLLTWKIAVSPDGRTILYAQQDESGSDLMLVENFK